MLITGNAIPKDQLDMEKILCFTAINDDALNSEYLEGDTIIKVAYSDTVTGSITYSYLNVTQQTVLTTVPLSSDLQPCDSGVDVEVTEKVVTDIGTGEITEVLQHNIFDKKTGDLLSTVTTLLDGTTAFTILPVHFVGKEPKRVVVGSQLLSINDATASTLTVPANTRGAFVQVHEGSDAKVATGSTAPTASYTGVGNVAYQGQSIVLHSSAEVAGFKAIAISGNGEIYVEYFNTSIETGV